MDFSGWGAHTAGMGPPVDTLTCPRCRRAARGGDRCPSCGLAQTGEHADRLRAVVGRLDAIGREQHALAAEATALRGEQAELLRALAGPLPAASERPGPESRPEVVRDVLLWLGSALVAVAALSFSLFAWRRLGDAGRAALLFAMTFLAAGGASFMRRRLPATAEALGGLTLALFLVDWFVLRRAGLAGGLSDAAWWSLGTGVAAGLSMAAARWLRLQAVAAAVLVQVSALLTVTRIAGHEWTLGLSLAALSVPLAAAAGRLARRRTWLSASVVLAVGATGTAAVALMVVEDLFVLGDGTTSARLAAILLTMALAPAAAVLALGPGSGARRDGLVAASAASLLSAVTMVLAAAWTSPSSLLAAVAVLGCAGIAAALAMPTALRSGCLYAAAGALAVGVVRLMEPVVEALVGPLGSVVEPWTAALGEDAVTHLAAGQAFGAAAVAFLALLAGSTVLIASGRNVVPEALSHAGGATAVVALVGTVPLAAGGPVWAAAAVTAAGALAAVGVATLADRQGLRLPTLASGAAAVVLATTAMGWALATEVGTLAFLACVAAGAGVATGWSRTARFRQALGAVAVAAAAGETAAIALSAGGSTAHAGLAAAMVGGAALVAGAFWRSQHPEGVALEAAGGAALAIGTALAATEAPWLAVTLSAATAWLAVAGSRPGRGHWLVASAATSVAATWAWLAVFDVRVAEAYTVPAAAVALLAGATARRRMVAADSWTAFGPGLTVGLLPSVVLVLGEGGLARPLVVTAAALAVLLAGARYRLQAPMVLGAGALLVVGLDALWPVAARVPRWAAIGTVGLLLLWLGATAEHRLAQLRDLGERFRRLEPDGPLGPAV